MKSWAMGRVPPHGSGTSSLAVMTSSEAYLALIGRCRQ